METTTKQCLKCKIDKDITNFYKQKGGKDGTRAYCNKCDIERSIEYHRSVNGLFSVIYSGQKKRSKEKGYSLPTYTKQELQDKYKNTEKFKNLYESWVKSNFHIDLTPSFDRKRDDRGYSLDNIRLVAWVTNKNKSYRDVKSGKLQNGNPQKKVYQFTKEGKFLKDFVSTSQASVMLDINQQNISSVCNNKRKYAGGFIFRFEKMI